ncbi:MAG: hypothetical protein D6731_15815 [Planctomycetota bacterium]|nr:MAG: hypothetical protein D6731_15815 [Planctomycetota bacterium]
MTDPRLAKLEARWRASGRLDDEAAYLRECVRLGALIRARVELAAFLEHPAAIQVVGSQASRLGPGPPLLGTWAQTLCAWGGHATTRAAVAYARAQLKVLRRETEAALLHGTTPGLAWVLANVPVLIERLSTVERWLAYREVETTERIKRFADLLPERGARPGVRGRAPRWESDLYELMDITYELSRSFQTGAASRWYGELAGRDRDLVSESPQVTEPIRRELVPWALRYRDPVQERVRAREGKTEIAPEDLEA